MSGQHTPGRLEAHQTGILRICVGDYCAPVAEICTPYRHGVGIVKGEHEAQANARRLAACWNACDGLSIENLEINITIKEGLRGLNAQLCAARALLADAADTFDEMPDEDHEIADRIRAFLAGAGLPAGAPP